MSVEGRQWKAQVVIFNDRETESYQKPEYFVNTNGLKREVELIITNVFP